jgi:hypothetical protein
VHGMLAVPVPVAHRLSFVPVKPQVKGSADPRVIGLQTLLPVAVHLPAVDKANNHLGARFPAELVHPRVKCFPYVLQCVKGWRILDKLSQEECRAFDRCHRRLLTSLFAALFKWAERAELTVIIQ